MKPFFLDIFIFLEINPACANITCQNGGSCLFIKETRNTLCVCDDNVSGEFCEGIAITLVLTTNKECSLNSEYLQVSVFHLLSLLKVTDSDGKSHMINVQVLVCKFSIWSHGEITNHIPAWRFLDGLGWGIVWGRIWGMVLGTGSGYCLGWLHTPY